MKKKTINTKKRAKPRRRADSEPHALNGHLDQGPTMEKLHRRAEAELRKRRKTPRPAAEEPKSPADTLRTLHELEVHQVELEMQNVELAESRDRMETLLEKYTDLYDFAPVAYLTLDEHGQILEANLTAATLLGVERSRLIRRGLSRFVVPASRPDFLTFLASIFAGAERQSFEAALTRKDAAVCWASFHGAPSPSLSDPRKCCRIAVSDISSIKKAQEAQRAIEALSTLNQEMRKEIVRRQSVEDALKQSEQYQTRLLDQSRQMQAQLRKLSHQILGAQEEERKRISRELHDVISQTLTSIDVRLTTLSREAALNTEGLGSNIAATQRLVEQAMHTVHQFARDLRPAVLDDLGLIPALHSLMKTFTAQTGIRTHLTAFAEVEKLGIDKRTALFRVAQEALTNVGRHAHACLVEVTIQKLPGAVGLTIEDNGRGFEVERGLYALKSNGLGLIGMRERVEMVNGSFAVESNPGKATTISAWIPLARNRARGEAEKPPIQHTHKSD